MCEKTEINQKHYDLHDQCCIICVRNGIEDPKLCPRVRGKCGHILHLHCIERWLQEHKTCPHASDCSTWVTDEQF